MPEERKKESKAKEGFEGKIKKIEDWLSTHDDKIGKQGQAKKSHVIDNESAKMMTGHGVLQGYNVKMLNKRGVDGYVADNQFRKRDPRYESAGRYKEEPKKTESKFYSADEFKYDEETKKLICPAGKYLYVKNRNFKTQQGHYGTVYMAYLHPLFKL